MGLTSQGIEKSPVWLIGDSDPEKWADKLKCVFDDRHPTFHNIWTPIIYKIQKELYKEKNKIIPDERFYITNAISDPSKKPKGNARSWDSGTIGSEKSKYLEKRLKERRTLISNNNPKMIITFGSFAFEFMRRCEGEKAEAFNHWNTKKLHEQFSDSIENKKRIIPLLHRSISMGRFLYCHEIFSDDGNYFEFVSKSLYKRMVDIIKLID
jgi:hypothetical protein